MYIYSLSLLLLLFIMDSSKKYSKFNVAAAGKTPKRTAHQLFRETEEDPEPVFTKNKRKVIVNEPICIEETEFERNVNEEAGFSGFGRTARQYYADRVNSALNKLEAHFGKADLWPQRLRELLLDSKTLSEFSCWVLCCFAYACEVPVVDLVTYLKLVKKLQKRGDFGFSTEASGIEAVHRNYDIIENDEMLKGSNAARVSEVEYFVFDPLYRRLVLVHNRQPLADKYPETCTWGKFSYGKYNKKDAAEQMY